MSYIIIFFLYDLLCHSFIGAVNQPGKLALAQNFRVLAVTLPEAGRTLEENRQYM